MQLEFVDAATLPHVDLRPVSPHAQYPPADPVDPEAARLIPQSSARRYGLLPFATTPDAVLVAVSDTVEGDGLRALEHLDLPVQFFRTSHSQLTAAQQRVWTPARDAREDRDAGAPLPLRRRHPASRRLGELLVDAGVIDVPVRDEAVRRQVETGGRLGAILVSANSATSLDVARAVAEQHALPVVDLQAGDGAGLGALDPSLFRAMPEGFWRDGLLVPLKLDGETLTVALADPADRTAPERLRESTGWDIRIVVTGQRDISAALQQVYGPAFTTESRQGLQRRQPDDSASYVLSAAQKVWGLALGALMIAAFVVRPLAALVVVNAVAQVFYLGLAFLKLGLMARLGRIGHGMAISGDDLAALDRGTLPTYTVLVPAYRETGVLPILAKALSELDYPHDRLDVKLLLEADDVEMVTAARALRLPSFIEIVVVPPSEPRTKPKACNYGLCLARGQYTVIFDAEDIPEPDQLLKAVVAFRRAGSRVGCIQAKLAYFNRDQSILTRWFTAEYVMWFDLLLPALHASPVPIPLGGTSNHFRTSVLRELGAWDPYNVAEDADLGIRLHKAGYRTAVMDATTYEEATARTGNWIRQRSRWVKGYMQTYLVHMRHPLRLWRALGTPGFIGFHALIGGTPLTLLLNPIYALLTTLWYLTHLGLLESPFPGWVYWVAAINLVIGTFAFTYANMVAVARRNIWDLMLWAALSPAYWSLMSIAAWKALIQLITRPSYWEKTDHGLATAPTAADLHGRSVAS